MKNLAVLIAVLITVLCLATPLFAEGEKRIDVGALISKADAEATLGEAVKDPLSRNGEGADGYYSRCNYYSESSGRSLVLRIRQSPVAKLDAKKEFAMINAGGTKLKAIGGLGDHAAIAPACDPGGKGRALMLYVAKGNALVTVGIGGVDDENVATEKAKAIATKIVSRL